MPPSFTVVIEGPGGQQDIGAKLSDHLAMLAAYRAVQVTVGRCCATENCQLLGPPSPLLTYTGLLFLISEDPSERGGVCRSARSTNFLGGNVVRESYFWGVPFPPGGGVVCCVGQRGPPLPPEGLKQPDLHQAQQRPIPIGYTMGLWVHPQVGGG